MNMKTRDSQTKGSAHAYGLPEREPAIEFGITVGRIFAE